MDKIGFYPADILIPKKGLEAWSVVACDQYTSDPGYWAKVEALTAGLPSAYHMIYPEVYLEKSDFDNRIASINKAMEEYWNGGIFCEYPSSLVYVERTLGDGSVRKGLIGMLDLEEYDYTKGSGSLVRATEGTVLDRLPPRVKIRSQAPLESPHIMVLIDDPDRQVIESFHDKIPELRMLYDFDLMMGGGNVRGYLLGEADYRAAASGLAKLAELPAFEARYGVKGLPALLYAVGDGNHSLAAAKECYSRIKEELGTEKALSHPARFALVELNNIHDDSLRFEAIHRAVFDVEGDAFVSALKTCCRNYSGSLESQAVTVLRKGTKERIAIPRPEYNLAVGSVQAFLDDYIGKNGGRVDYIHGEDTARRLAAEGAVCLLLEPMKKSELFRTVILEGALPRKTFSMGEAFEKRYYLECRLIRN